MQFSQSTTSTALMAAIMGYLSILLRIEKIELVHIVPVMFHVV